MGKKFIRVCIHFHSFFSLKSLFPFYLFSFFYRNIDTTPYKEKAREPQRKFEETKAAEAKKEESTSTPTQTETTNSKLDDKSKNSVKNLIAEYYSLKDLGEAKECVKELSVSENTYPEVIKLMVDTIRKEPQIADIQKLLLYMHKENIFTSAHLQTAFKEKIETLEEDSEEFPNLPKFFGFLIGGCVSADAVPLSFLPSVVGGIESPTTGAKFNISIISRVFTADDDEAKIKDALKAAGFNELTDVTRKLNRDRLQRFSIIVSLLIFPFFFIL